MLRPSTSACGACGVNYVAGISTTMPAHPGEAATVTEPHSGSGRPPPVKYRTSRTRSSSWPWPLDAGRRSRCNGVRPPSPASAAAPSDVPTVRGLADPLCRTRGRPGRRRPGIIRVLAPGPVTRPGEPVRFWPSDLPADTPLTTQACLVKLHGRTEHDYRGMKEALGPAHFEGSSWSGRHHHATLVSVAHAFGALQRPAGAPKARRRPEPPPQCPRATDRPRDMDRGLPHLPTATYPHPHQPEQPLVSTTFVINPTTGEKGAGTVAFG